MKKIAIFVQWLLCAGVEKALLNLSEELVNSGNDVTIYVIQKKGEFINDIPKGVKLKVIPMDEKIRENIPVGGTKITVRNCLAEKKYIKAIKFLVKRKLNNTPFAELEIQKEKISNLKEKYDIAVNFHLHSPFLVWYFSEKVIADKKYTWIHNDFETTGYKINELKEYLTDIDRFFTVSQKIKNEFVSIFPEYKNKTEFALNIVNDREIKLKANEFYPKEFENCKSIKLLTVGRLEEQKGYDIAIEVCMKLKEEGLQFDWFVLGEGTLRKQLESEIEKKKIDNCFHLLGVKTNPYPYFKNADIYVQTSKHEGYVTTVTEAKILNKPIVCTDVSGAREQLIDNINGSIAEINAISVYNKLKELIIDKNKRDTYTETLEQESGLNRPNWLKYFE